MTNKEGLEKIIADYKFKEKVESGYVYHTEIPFMEAITNIMEDLEILKQYKNIEKELGVDLLTLFKALKDGIWIREGFYGTCILEGGPIFIKPHCLHLGIYDYYGEKTKEGDYGEHEAALCFYDMIYEDVNNIAKVKDYGKTWSLDKQTLEKQ